MINANFSVGLNYRKGLYTYDVPDADKQIANSEQTNFNSIKNANKFDNAINMTAQSEIELFNKVLLGVGISTNATHEENYFLKFPNTFDSGIGGPYGYKVEANYDVNDRSSYRFLFSFGVNVHSGLFSKNDNLRIKGTIYSPTKTEYSWYVRKGYYDYAGDWNPDTWTILTGNSITTKTYEENLAASYKLNIDGTACTLLLDAGIAFIQVKTPDKQVNNISPYFNIGFGFDMDIY